MPDKKKQKALIHIGRPDISRPHCNLSVIQKFVGDNPDCAVVIVVDTQEDYDAMNEKVKSELKWPTGHPGGFIIHWTEDGGLIDFLCSKMFGTLSWRVVGNGWYECPDKHEASPTLTEPIEKCPTCQKPFTFIRHNEPRVDSFKTLLEKAAKLMRFDTRSGDILRTLVNPDANVLKNMAAIIGCKHEKALGLSEFVGKSQGKPAVCVSAGPSLDDEIDNLRRLQDRCLILCVGRLYKRLRAAEIRVDYTFSCEMFDWDSVIFDGVTDAGDTILCYPNVCAPATVAKWPGKKVCTLDPQMAELLGEKVWMMGGNSVSHHQLNFAAEILGCEPVILVGQDLAYTKPSVTHASNSSPDGWPDEVKAQDSATHAQLEWGPCYGKSGRFHPETHRQAAFISGGKVAPVGGMEVLTSAPYKDFGTLFEVLVSRHKKKILNACGEGLMIGGVPYVNLSEWNP